MEIKRYAPLSIKLKIVVPMTVMDFIAVLAILIFSVLRFSGFIDTYIESELSRAVLVISHEIETAKPAFRMDNQEFAARLKSFSGCDIAVFSGHECTATTLHDEDGVYEPDYKALEEMNLMIRADNNSSEVINLFNHKLLAKCIPLSDADGKTSGILVAGYMLAYKTAALWSFFIAGFLVCLFLTGLSVPFIVVVAGRVSAPVEKLLDKEHYDALTGVYNRRYVDENLKNLINIMSRPGGMLSLLMIDIDFFQKYNDKYGYSKGDNCLKIVANALLKGVSRTEDFVARYGGDKFVVVLPNTGEEGARTITRKLLEFINECKIPYEEDGVSGYVTISAGLTTGKVSFSQSGDEYIRRAGEILNKSKQNGRNRYIFENL